MFFMEAIVDPKPPGSRLDADHPENGVLIPCRLTVPLADAPRQAGVTLADTRRPTPQAGFGVTLVPLQYVTAVEMQRLLDPLVRSGAIISADTTRNLLIIGGTEAERTAILDDIALFDVDWLSGMSFALYTPKSVAAQELARELGQVIGGRDSPLAGIVRLVPIERMNAVLAISPQARYLEQLQGWVERLDRPGERVDKRLYVYYVQNGRATDLASVVIRAIGGAASGNIAPSRLIAPGEGPEIVLQPPLGAMGRPAQPEFGRAMSVAPAPEAPSPPQPLAPTAGPPPGGTGGALNIAGLGDVTITADEVNNALVILATPTEYSVIEGALRQLDRVPLQVLLEAAVAEVTLTNELKFGVQYFFRSGNNQTILSNSGTAAITPPLPGFAYVFSQGAGIQIILNALENVTHVDVLSAPEVLVLNNQVATLQVGDQVPIATTQAVSVLTPGAPIVNSIQFRDTGIILKVTPRVNQGGMVMMDIAQEVSDVSATTTSALNSPTITQRRISSTVAVHDGETIALGGLIKDGRTVTKTGIPLLQDIPVLGSLFRSIDDQRTRTELLVLITPHVVESLEQARSVTEELRRRLPATAPVVERGR